MKEKRNELWKLDLLEAKYTQATPRFSFTKKLINARNNSHVMKKLPSTPNEAFQQIHALKSDLFRKKYHGSYKKLSRDVARAVKSKKTTETEHVQKLMLGAEFLEALITAKLVKLVSSAILTTKEAKQDPPAYIAEDVREYITDKSSAKNPSRFFINYCQNDKVLNNYLSKLWNSKEMKTLCQEIEWSFRKIRGNLTKAELAARASETGTNAKDVTKDESGDISEESEDSDDSEGESESEAHAEIDAEEAFDKFSAYDNMVAGSDDEQDFVADPNVDYNEITDEEMSGKGESGESELESESESESESGSESESNEIDRKSAKVPKKEVKTDKKEAKKPTKVALPQLATGYYSGGSDDEEEDVDNDKIVKEATTQRKNRRGQRARQKIWEQKYGKSANHVQKENSRIASEREQRQKEFEERQRKREMKEKMAQETNTSKTAGSSSSSGMKVHPSWEAKKLAEEKLKNVKFTGKKITFD